LKIFQKNWLQYKKIYKNNEVNGIIYFVDLDLMKNKNYYKEGLVSLFRKLLSNDEVYSQYC